MRRTDGRTESDGAGRSLLQPTTRPSGPPRRRGAAAVYPSSQGSRRRGGQQQLRDRRRRRPGVSANAACAPLLRRLYRWIKTVNRINRPEEHDLRANETRPGTYLRMRISCGRSSFNADAKKRIKTAKPVRGISFS